MYLHEDKKKELKDYLKNKNKNGRILIEILGDKFKNKFLDSLLEKKIMNHYLKI